MNDEITPGEFAAWTKVNRILYEQARLHRALISGRITFYPGEGAFLDDGTPVTPAMMEAMGIRVVRDGVA